MVDFKDTEEEAAFRAEVRAFIAQHGDKGRVPYENHYFPPPEMAAWRAALVERRWIAPAWPAEVGGAALTLIQQFILNQELAEHGLTNVGGLGVGYFGPTLLVHGTEEQKREHLAGILRGDVVWCQGWSEPGAGSDLAALQTRAVREGDEYVVNGQKIWTSGAEVADKMYFLARTDSDAPKHRGISLLTVDMDQPGISVRPLTTMDGRTAFTEVFFEDVHVPVRNRIGAENMGWYVAMTLTDFERASIGSNITAQAELQRALDAARAEARDVSARGAAWRLEFVDRWIECELARLFAYRVVTMHNRGFVPSYEGSVAKLFLSELNQRISRTRMRLYGLYAALWGASRSEAEGGDPASSYLRAVSLTIGGGTSEIQRNVIATRGLGLPRG